jgi:hypothetical protein
VMIERDLEHRLTEGLIENRAVSEAAVARA